MNHEHEHVTTGESIDESIDADIDAELRELMAAEPEPEESETETPAEVGAIESAIIEYAAANELEGSTFGRLLDVAACLTDRHGYGKECADQFRFDCWDAEENYLYSVLPATEFAELPRFKSGEKEGRPKPHPLIPQTYYHAKSTIATAIEGEIALHDEDGELMGKSALEKAKREAKGKAEKTPQEKLSGLVHTVASLCRKTDDPVAAALDFVNALRAEIKV